MTLLKHEWKQGGVAFAVWTAVISFMLAVCIFVYPEMKSEMDSLSEVFASMGSFTQAFGMDQLNFGTLTGFYAVECGNVLGLGGAFFACLTGIAAVSKEEKSGTAEFLLTHPISRCRILTEKLLAVLTQVIGMNGIILGISLVSMVAIGEQIPVKQVLMLHAAYLVLQLELACICFGISAFLSKAGLGLGIGIGTAMYFLNILANMTEGVKFLKYITPFGYCDGAQIVNQGELDLWMLLIGTAFAALGVCAAYWKYPGKDIK